MSGLGYPPTISMGSNGLGELMLELPGAVKFTADGRAKVLAWLVDHPTAYTGFTMDTSRIVLTGVHNGALHRISEQLWDVLVEGTVG